MIHKAYLIILPPKTRAIVTFAWLATKACITTSQSAVSPPPPMAAVAVRLMDRGVSPSALTVQANVKIFIHFFHKQNIFHYVWVSKVHFHALLDLTVSFLYLCYTVIRPFCDRAAALRESPFWHVLVLYGHCPNSLYTPAPFRSGWL